MANEDKSANDAKPREAADQNTAHPPGWPGIPGRSQEHEENSERSSDVTEQQRQLEREMTRK